MPAIYGNTGNITEIFRMGKISQLGLNMNEFMFVAIVAGEWGYMDNGDRQLPVWVNGRVSDGYAVIAVDRGCSLPPDEELEEGEEITVAGMLAVVNGRIAPFVTSITRNGEEEDDDGG
jgi:hypothetical protein